MPTLAITNFNIVLTVLGAWITLFGLVSYVSKDRLYLSDPLISLLVGVALSPLAANLIRPLEYVGGSEVTLDEVTLGFSRLVLGVQLVMAGVHLPSRYLRRQWRPLTILVGPVMAGMWLMTSLLVWGLVVVPFRGSTVDGTGVLWALAIGACVTPTDPVLSGVIVKGRFADDNVPQELQRLIIAESGANDGLGYPFLFLPLFLLKYVAAGGGNNQSPVQGGASTAMGMWFGETWGYVVILGAVYGAVAGWVAKELLHWADRRKFVDRESFLVSSIAMALFIVGTGGMLGSDDVLACFVAGNVFTWDDWFRLETLDDMLEPTVDMLCTLARRPDFSSPFFFFLFVIFSGTCELTKVHATSERYNIHVVWCHMPLEQLSAQRCGSHLAPCLAWDPGPGPTQVAVRARRTPVHSADQRRSQW
ncbi:hypothetical protein MCOR25_009377 [Pyricularia grisea]|nr:hypothetical protein MCOR25_009377 [Pyricularia grisea]